MIVPALERIHPDPFHSTSKADLEAAVRTLSEDAASLTNDQLMVGVLRIVAMISASGCDAHTGAYVWGSGTYPLYSLPLRLWLFGDEVVIVDAMQGHEDLIGARIDAFNAMPTAQVMAALTPLIPRDNDQTVRLLMPRFLLIRQIWHGLGLGTLGVTKLSVTKPGGATADVDVEQVPMAEYNAWAGAYGLHLPADPDVRYLSRIDDPLWWEVLEDGESLYVQYNRVDRLPSTLLADLGAAMDDPAVARVVLDIRHNYGGELSALDEITPMLVGAARGEADRLFVLIGRNTFSAGSLLAARLERDAKATLIGEPTGGCPTVWSDPTDVPLPSSGIVVSIAGDTAVGVDPADPRLTVEPSVSAILTADEWLDRIDPGLANFEIVAP